MTATALQLPSDVLEQARAAAREADLPVEDLLVAMIADGLRQRNTLKMMRERAGRADPGAALAILSRAPDVPPDAGDERPTGASPR